MEFKEFKPSGCAGIIAPYTARVFDTDLIYESRPWPQMTFDEFMSEKRKQLEADLFCGGSQSSTTATTQEWNQGTMPSLAELTDLAEKFRRPRLYAGSSKSSALRDLIKAIPTESRRLIDVISDSPMLSRPPVGPTWFAHLAPGIYKCGKDFYLVE